MSKRVKRDRVQRAKSSGYKSGLRGHNTGSCPFVSDLNLKEQWLTGWRKGHSQFEAGFRS